MIKKIMSVEELADLSDDVLIETFKYLQEYHFHYLLRFGSERLKNRLTEIANAWSLNVKLIFEELSSYDPPAEFTDEIFADAIDFFNEYVAEQNV